MADCRNKIIREDCGTVEVGDGKVTLKQCGEELGDFTMDQCENTTIEIPCPENLSCDDCLVYLEPGETGPAPALADLSQVYLLKFSSDTCGICHRMGHYDCTVAEEMGLVFECVKDDDTVAMDYWAGVWSELYPNGDMGFPTYIMVEWTDEDNFQVIGEVVGGSDKGLFKARIKELFEVWNYSGTQPAADCKQGSGADQNGNHCVTQTCSKFKWDCVPNSVKVCQGGCYDAYASTHGCNGSCTGSELQYRWLLSEPGQKKYKVVKDWSRNVRWTIEVGDDIPVGKKYDGRIEAKCDDFDGDKKESLIHEFEVEVKACGKQCPGNDFVEIENCPNNPKKAGSTYTLTANVEGLANSGVTFYWYKGGTSGELVKTGGRNYDALVPNTPGNTQKYTVKAVWNQDDSCKATAECILEAKVPSGCSSNSDCPSGQICVDGDCVDKPECEDDGDCGQCQKCSNQNKCVNKCADSEECENGKCVEKEGELCPEGGWALDYNCISDKIGGGGGGGDDSSSDFCISSKDNGNLELDGKGCVYIKQPGDENTDWPLYSVRIFGHVTYEGSKSEGKAVLEWVSKGPNGKDGVKIKNSGFGVVEGSNRGWIIEFEFGEELATKRYEVFLTPGEGSYDHIMTYKKPGLGSEAKKRFEVYMHDVENNISMPGGENREDRNHVSDFSFMVIF